MRVGLVVFANKQTGAAAVAELVARALLSVGVETRLLFVAGRNLERRLAAERWAEPALTKERSPGRVVANLGALRDLADEVDVVVCHLPHDHALCVAAGVHRRALLVRSFRNPRHLRSDPWHRALARTLDGALLAHSEMEGGLARVIGGIPSLTAPVPLEDRFAPGAAPEGWRWRLAVPAGATLVGMVGKLAAGRGFDLLLETAARLPADVHVVAVGHGEARPALERHARRLGLADRVHWAGYVAEGLPDLYAALDVALFCAPGSDHGHRAISEAQACARPVVAAAVPGVSDLVADGRTGVVAEPAPGALAEAVARLLHDRDRARELGLTAAKTTSGRRLPAVGSRLARFLGELAAV